MEFSKIRPDDRPYKIFCRTCETYTSSKFLEKTIFDYRAKKKVYFRWPPKDLRDNERDGGFYCKVCGNNCGFVYEFKGDEKSSVGEIKKISKPIPHCGNEKCEGYCDDPLCLPVEQKQEIVNINKKEKNNISVALPIFCFVVLSYLIWPFYSFWSLPASFIIVCLLLGIDRS